MRVVLFGMLFALTHGCPGAFGIIGRGLWFEGGLLDLCASLTSRRLVWLGALFLHRSATNVLSNAMEMPMYGHHRLYVQSELEIMR